MNPTPEQRAKLRDVIEAKIEEAIDKRRVQTESKEAALKSVMDKYTEKQPASKGTSSWIDGLRLILDKHAAADALREVHRAMYRQKHG